MKECEQHPMDDMSLYSRYNLSSHDIKDCRRELKDILIAPFDESKCKGVGYNLSPSELCYSVNRRCPTPGPSHCSGSLRHGSST